MGCGGSKKDSQAQGPKNIDKETLPSGAYEKNGVKSKKEEIPDEEAVVITDAKVVKKKLDNFGDNNEEPKVPIIVAAKRETPAPKSEVEEIKVKSITPMPAKENTPMPAKENVPVTNIETYQMPPPRPPAKLPPLAEKPNFPNMKPEFDFGFLEETDKQGNENRFENQKRANEKIVIVDQLLEEFNDI